MVLRVVYPGEVFRVEAPRWRFVEGDTSWMVLRAGSSLSGVEGCMKKGWGDIYLFTSIRRREMYGSCLFGYQASLQLYGEQD